MYLGLKNGMALEFYRSLEFLNNFLNTNTRWLWTKRYLIATAIPYKSITKYHNNMITHIVNNETLVYENLRNNKMSKTLQFF